MRSVICHYHIYKNSGTSFDALLTDNFGSNHICFDGPFPYFAINQRELNKIIQRHKTAVAFSSHQISLPVPSSLEFNILPVVFVRHPLLRISSIYHFKREEKDGTTTSDNAQRMDFGTWCRHSLKDPIEVTHVSNSQTKMLAGREGAPALSKRSPSGMTYDINHAIRNLRSVELLARTEHFARDVSRFVGILGRHGIDFEMGDAVPKNVTSSNLEKSVEERLVAVREGLSAATLDALLDANEQDLRLYDEASRILA